jgi:hypothetical protein
MTIEQWVRRLNALAREMDAVCYSTHPSAWSEQLRDLNEKYRGLAAQVLGRRKKKGD